MIYPPGAQEKANKRLLHIKSHVEGAYAEANVREEVDIIHTGKGDPIACAMLLCSNAAANAMRAWFEDHDLASLQQWAYVAAKLNQMYYQMEVHTHSPGGKMLKLLYPLLSNHNALIDWFAHYDAIYDPKRVENHKTADFRAYQAIVALRGDWPRLLARCERVLNDSPGARSEQKYALDHQFYLGLAQGNVAKMQDTLLQLVTPKVLRSRSNNESGYTDDLISSYAVIYAKIAWRHGYHLQLDSPYIPAEWLPTTPLARYDNHYDFLKE